MNPESWGFIGTLLGAIVGASASIFTTRINSKNAIRIQSNLDKYKREEKFRDFQRENLLKTQEKLYESFRLVGMAHLEDLKNYMETNKWEISPLNPKFENDLANTFRQIAILTERIDNNDLRAELGEIRKLMTKCLVVTTHSDSQKMMMKLSDQFDDLMKKLGVILRSNY